MSDKLLRNQYQVSAQTPMPVDPMDSSSLGSTYSEGTVQLYYYNAGVRTTDAGQAAGTVVDGVFTYRNILDSLGVAIACKDNTSLAFTCLAMTEEVDPSAHPQLLQIMEGNDTSTPSEKAAAIGAFLSNGQYVVDYRKSVVWVKKATTAASMTGVSYKISSASDEDGYTYVRSKAYDATTSADRNSLIRDISDQYTNDTFTLTNVPNATPDETTIVDMDGYDGCSIHIENTGGTDTFEATIEASNEGAESTSDWLDVTQYGFTNACGADAASYTADTILFSKPDLNVKAYKVKITTADGGDDADFQIFIKRWKK